MLRGSHFSQEGQAVITSVIFFLTISMVVMAAIATPIASQIRASADFLQSKQGYLAAEAANEDAFYRLNRGRTLPATFVLPFTDSTSSATVTDVGSAKQIVSLGNAGSFTRTAKTQFSSGIGASFSYGLQVGNGGYLMSGSAGINGNVYSNGDIVGSGGPYITGSAIVATVSNPVADQSNTGSTTPSYSISFGTTTATQDLAESFKVSTTTTITEVSLYIKKTNSPSNATVRIMTDNAGKPSSTSLTTGTLSAASLTTSYGWVTVSFASNPSLTVGTTYWLVVDTTVSASAPYTIASTNNTYTNGSSSIGTVGGTWSNLTPISTLDMYFNLYVGGDQGSISGVTIGSGGVGDAQAHSVSNSTVAGTIYCQIGTSNNKLCDTSRADPSPQSFPVSQSNINAWEDEALAGGSVVGPLSYGGSTATSTGPKKIIGNLTVNAGAVLTVNGTLYITGNLNVSGGGKILLSSSYGASSGVIVVDGTISLSGGGQVLGSGTTGSYVLLLTNSTCPTGAGCGGLNAIEAGGGTGAVVLNAQNGTINFSGGTAAKAAVAYKMIMGGGTTITYDSGLASMNFSSGPSGAWNVDSWKEVSQ